MLRGHLDTLTSEGYIEGWAFDTERPTAPLSIAVLDIEGREIASGLANGYRKDLMQAGCGIGWCFFRLKGARTLDDLRRDTLKLIVPGTGDELHESDSLTYVEEPLAEAVLPSELEALDPTVLQSVEHLEGCGEVFERFVGLYGEDLFVRTAYLYLFGRAADPAALALYADLLRERTLTPYLVLRLLSVAAEFQSRPKSLCAPNTPSFPFLCDDHV